MRNLKQKWIAWLAVICMLAAMVPATVLAVMADGDPIFSNLQVQFIGRLPSTEKSGLYVSLSNDGETWTDPVEYKGHGEGAWGCCNVFTGDYYCFGAIDVTEQAKSLTSDRFFVKVGMGAGAIDQTVLHQVRIVGWYTGASQESQFFWEDYSNLEAFNRTGDNAAEAAEDVVKKVAYAVSANNVFLYQCTVDHQATGLSPYHGGYYGEPENVNAHVVYGINQPATDGVYFELLGRLPGDTVGNAVQLQVGTNGYAWEEAALYTGITSGDIHGRDTYVRLNITDAVDLTAHNLYVKMNLIAAAADHFSIRQMRITHVVDGVENVLMHVIYDDMAIGTEEYKSGMYVDSANVQLRGTYDASSSDPSGLTMNEDCDMADGKVLGDNYITYKIALKDGPEPDVPAPADKVYFEIFGRLPGDSNGSNFVQVLVGNNGVYWNEATHYEGPIGDHSDSTHAKIDITDAVDLTANNLYVKLNPAVYFAEWYSIRQIRVSRVAADGTDTTLLHVNYDDMAIGSEEYKSGMYVDSANVQLRGTYDASANDPSGLTVNEDCDGQDGKGLGDAYITYKIALKESEMPYVYGGGSVSEDVSGLAMIYKLDVDGIAAQKGTANVADFTNATFGGYKLLSVGAIATNGVVSADINGVYMYELDGNEVSFAFRLINIPADKLDVTIVMTPYVVVEIDGVATTLYGEPTAASYNGVLNG